MLRKINTSQSRRRFLHQQPQNQEPKINAVTRPPTSHPYSCLRNIRSLDTIHTYSNYFNKSYNQKQLKVAVADTKNNNIVSDVKLKENSISKIFIHLLTQIRILFGARQKQADKQISFLLGNLSKKINEVCNQNIFNRQKLQNTEQQILRILEENEELMKKLKKLESITSHNGNFYYKDSSKAKGYEVVIENVKLAQLNEAYLSKINDLENCQKQKHVEIKKQVHQSQSTEVLRHLNRISYLEMKLKNSEQKEVQLNSVVKDQQKKHLELLEQIQALNEQKRGLIQNRNQWRQRAQMQVEDSQMHLTRQNFLLFSIKKLRQLNKGLTEKLLNKTTNEGHSIKNEIEPNSYFQYEVDFFKSIKSIYFQSKYKDFKMSLTSKKQQNLEIVNFELEAEYLQYRKFQEINLTLFTYYMPKFYSFIEDSITTQISNTRIKGNGSVSRVFIQILRAILRSKLNEFVMLSEEQFTRFPQFVYSWFQKFYFNSEKGDIATLQPYMQKPFPQDLFYRDLMNIKLDQSWEIITFREFLLEELNLQQLYFYLMCQNLLFRKAGITKSKQYQGDFSILIDYNAAKLVLDMVLSDFQSWNLNYLISKMREKIIYKKNVEYIQSGFFLRCLVQYYKIERINRYKYICKLCEQFKSEQKGLRFSSFISIINRFTEVSIEQKIKLYRDCFCLGKGQITADIIFTVCSQNLIFLKYLKLKCFFKLPHLSTQNNCRSMQLTLKKSSYSTQPQKKSIICLQPSDPYLYKIYTKMIGLVRNESIFTSQIQKLGLIEVMNDLTQMQKLFNDRLSSRDNSVLRCRHFMHFLNEITNKIKIINFTNFYQLLEEENKKRNNEPFWIEINQSDLCQILANEFNATIGIYQNLTKQIEWKNKVYDFRLHHAARKIQRMVRKKFIAPFLQLYKNIYSEFKNGELIKK